MNLNKRIRAWREHVGMRVDDLAETLEVTPPAVYQWEQDADPTTPSLKHLASMVDAFGISMVEFWGVLPKKKKAS